MSYQMKLSSVLRTLTEANEDPIAFAKSKGFDGTDDYLLGAAKGWVRQSIKDAEMYGKLIAEEAADTALRNAAHDAWKADREAKQSTPSTTWREKVEEMVEADCYVQIHYGMYGVGCVVTDPNSELRVNVSSKASEQEAVDAAYKRREEHRPAVSEAA